VAAIRQHTIESLQRVFRRPVTLLFHRRDKPYDARFSVGTAELLVDCEALSQATGALRAVFGDDGWAAAFRRGGGAQPSPVALVGRHPSDASTVLRVGRWAAGALDLAAAIQGDRPLLATASSTGTFVAVERDGLMLAGSIAHDGAARVLNRVATHRRRAERSHGDF
jgi:hypothetical protein